jgi:hypothetical protein
MSEGGETRHGERTSTWSPADAPDGLPPAPPAPGSAPAAPARSWTVPAPTVPLDQPPVRPSGTDATTIAPSPYVAPAPVAPAPAAWSPPAWSPPPGGPPGYGPAPGWPPPGAPVPPSAGSGGGLWALFAVLTVVALAAVAFMVVAVAVTVGDDDPDTRGSDPVAAEEAGRRLAPEPPIPATDGPHAFFHVEPDGDPVAWDPCDPIRYVVNDARAPEGAMEILDEAIALVEQATGLVFVDEGATDETVPVGDEDRPDSDPGRYGDGWSPVLISWTDAMAEPELDGAAGLASPRWREAASGERVYVTGYVELAGDVAARLIARGGRDDVLGIMMHELGHLVGLQHVAPADHVMTDDPRSTPSVWASGDLVGLAAVGRGECEPDV